MSDDHLGRIEDLESEVQTLAEAVALLCFALDSSPGRTPPLAPEAHAAREAEHLIRKFMLGRNMPDVDAFRKRVRDGELRKP